MERYLQTFLMCNDDSLFKWIKHIWFLICKYNINCVCTYIKEKKKGPIGSTAWCRSMEWSSIVKKFKKCVYLNDHSDV